MEGDGSERVELTYNPLVMITSCMLKCRIHTCRNHFYVIWVNDDRGNVFCKLVVNLPCQAPQSNRNLCSEFTHHCFGRMIGIMGNFVHPCHACFSNIYKLVHRWYLEDVAILTQESKRQLLNYSGDSGLFDTYTHTTHRCIF